MQVGLTGRQLGLSFLELLGEVEGFELHQELPCFDRLPFFDEHFLDATANSRAEADLIGLDEARNVLRDWPQLAIGDQAGQDCHKD